MHRNGSRQQVLKCAEEFFLQTTSLGLPDLASSGSTSLELTHSSLVFSTQLHTYINHNDMHLNLDLAVAFSLQRNLVSFEMFDTIKFY
jgi:hypothetical protein